MFILLLTAVGLTLFGKFLSSRPVDLQESAARIDEVIGAEISQSVWDIPTIDETKERVADHRAILVHVSRSYRLPPAEESADDVVNGLTKTLALEGARLHVLSEDPENIVASITLAGVETHSLRFIKTPAPNVERSAVATAGLTDTGPAIAIIVDDLGYGGEATDLLLSLEEPLTVSVLPGLPGSERTAQRASNAGFEVMLHLPMEAVGDKPVDPGELRTGMSRANVARLIERNLVTVPGAVGVNNHKGSKLTTCENEMAEVMSVLSEHHLYFVDSLTTSESVALDVARRAGLSSIGNDVFLDNEDDPIDMQERFEELIRVARRRGFAVGICHAKPATMEVLRETLPAMRARGYRLVRVSELLEEDAKRHARAGS
jgi:polysaccharide deacetylase 2 family uncharacterized protein YibQ